MKKHKIELSPYTCLSLLKFLREFINDDKTNKKCLEFQAIHESVTEFENEVYKMTESMVDEGIHESRVNDLIGKHPKPYL